MDPDAHRKHRAGSEVLSESVMDQALNWLIELDSDDAQQLARFDAWLAADNAHREAYAQVHAVWHSQPVAQAAAAMNPPPVTLRRVRRHSLPIAAAALVVLGVFTLSNLHMRLQADHVTVVGERQRVQLAEGAKVLLNTDSAFSSEFSDERRVARLLHGEAFFELDAGAKRPLEVLTGKVSMRAESGEFAVRYLDGVTQIQVQNGALDVRASQSSNPITLASGDSIRVGPDGLSQREALDQQRLAWIDGRLVFDNCPLSEVLAELGRYYPGWIINANKHLGTVAVTGNYQLDQPLDVIRSLAQVTSAHVYEMPALVILN